MTGLWQVSWHCELAFDRRMKSDMRYIDQWTIDMDRLLLTLLAVISGAGEE
jgi:lipopolysaccharide/colanic/teichoic acid biosynthesis glycosyltransferase